MSIHAYDWKILFKEFYNEKCSQKEGSKTRVKILYDAFSDWLKEKGYSPDFSIKAFGMFFPKEHPEYEKQKVGGFFSYNKLYINDEEAQKKISFLRQEKRDDDKEYQRRKREEVKKFLAEKNNLIAIDYDKLDINPEKWKIEDINMSSLTHWLTRLEEFLHIKITVKELSLVKRYFTLGKYKCEEASISRKELANIKLWNSLFTFFKIEILRKVEETMKKDKDRDLIYSRVRNFLYDEKNQDIMEQILKGNCTELIKEIAITHFSTDEDFDISCVIDLIILEHLHTQETFSEENRPDDP